MNKLFLACLLLVLGRPVFASYQWAVAIKQAEGKACCTHGGVPDADIAARNISIVVSPNDTVEVLKQTATKLLIGRASEGYQGWFDKSYFVTEASFRPLDTWNGPSKFIASSEDGGTEVTYHFRKDGTFTASAHSDNDGAAPPTHSKFAGRLYIYKGILLAKQNGVAVDNPYFSLLRVGPNGKLCLNSIPSEDFCN